MKNKIPLSPPNTADNCKALCEEFDLAIGGSIDANKPLGIEELIEIPFRITSELIESSDYGVIDDSTRGLVFLYQIY